MLVLTIGPAAGKAQPLPPTPAEEEPRPVRAYFADRSQLLELTRRYEPWEIHPDLGYAVVAVDPAGLVELAALGLRVESDPAFDLRLARQAAAAPDQAGAIPGFPCYRSVSETYSAAAGLARARPDLAEWIDIGDSWEKSAGLGSGSDIFVLRLTNSAAAGPKPKAFLMSGVHARELASVELLTRFGEWLVNSHGSHPDATLLLDYSEIHLLLYANPDGRRYAETGLWWRKNTNRAYCSPTSQFRGADLNRNFDFEWGNWGGSSGETCSEIYRGPIPASEPEVQAIQSYLRAQYADRRGPLLSDAAPDDTQGLLIDVHSYGRQVLWPWGFTAAPPPNAAGLQTLGRRLAYFNHYDPDQAYSLYPIDGASDDFAYGDMGLAALTVELGDYFFESCSTFENDILSDNLKMLRFAVRTARAPYLLPSGPDAHLIQVQPQPDASTAVLTATLDDTRSHLGGVPSQPIAAAEYWLNSPPWGDPPAAPTGQLTPLDGDWDEPVETAAATIDLTGLGPGRHRVFVRGLDASGAYGPVSMEFLVLGSPVYLPLAVRP